MVKDRTVRLTAAGQARLSGELADLQTRRLPALTARIQEASQHGDVTDNGEYEELKEERATLEARIRDLEQTLERAEIIHRDAEDETVGLGSKVTLRSDDGDEETWVLVSPEEANALDGTISTASPVGRAVLGCRAGDAPTVTTPGGSIVFTVLSVA